MKETMYLTPTKNIIKNLRSFNTEDGIANETKMWPYVIYIMYMFVPVPVYVHH